MIPQKPIGKAKVILQLLLGFKILYDDTDTYNNRREHPVRAASYYCSENSTGEYQRGDNSTAGGYRD